MVPAPNANEKLKEQQKQGREKPFDINQSVDGRSSISGTSARTHISKWEQ